MITGKVVFKTSHVGSFWLRDKNVGVPWKFYGHAWLKIILAEHNYVPKRKKERNR